MVDDLDGLDGLGGLVVNTDRGQNLSKEDSKAQIRRILDRSS